MNITKIIKKFALPCLCELEFEYKGVEAGNRWLFQRQVNGVSQGITLAKSDLFQALRIEFQTSNRKGKPPIVGDAFIDDNKYWWEYTDEESLKEVIKQLCDIATKNLETLHLLSLPDYELNTELYKLLIQDPKEKAHYISQQYSLNFEDAHRSLSRLMDILNEIDNNQEKDKRLLVYCAAFLGELVIAKFGGTWIWDEEISLTYIRGTAGGSMNANVLEWVTGYWWKPKLKINDLIFRYKILAVAYDNRLN